MMAGNEYYGLIFTKKHQVIGEKWLEMKLLSLTNVEKRVKEEISWKLRGTVYGTLKFKRIFGFFLNK